MVVAEIDQQLIKTSVAGKKKKTKLNKTEQWMEAMEEALCSGPVCVDYKNERVTVLSIDASKRELVTSARAGIANGRESLSSEIHEDHD